jgi:hypothetical protein
VYDAHSSYILPYPRWMEEAYALSFMRHLCHFLFGIDTFVHVFFYPFQAKGYYIGHDGFLIQPSLSFPFDDEKSGSSITSFLLPKEKK